ncbi:DUF488 domain-containing protein [Salinarchaeum sp. Harcht-Bsk1]|uniref:DUF488 domain-containing protein n=1 Tax=Salinarchaeum sp. Harcht-Bsk1 TaxID=1333523 RepID=UPI000677A97C|nr:DUF488 domain-containing protein [Salinarchaeum sp. Harcht-Bsk1]
MTGTVHDTYVAAIRHDLVDLPEDARRIGVVRRPTSWFHGAVDENVPALGPPEDLLEDAKQREEDLKLQGICDDDAQNVAWDEVDFAERYRDYLETEEGSVAEDRLAELLREGTDVVLVCFENTEKKRCHRTILREVLEERVA